MTSLRVIIVDADARTHSQFRKDGVMRVTLMRKDKKSIVDFWLFGIRQSVRRFLFVPVCILVAFGGQGCHNTRQPEPVKTLTLIGGTGHQAWSSRDYRPRFNDVLGQFTQQTGIRVEFLPAPETAVEQLATSRKLLEGGAPVPDVYSMDVI